jgi:hypothetical protein
MLPLKRRASDATSQTPEQIGSETSPDAPMTGFGIQVAPKPSLGLSSDFEGGDRFLATHFHPAQTPHRRAQEALAYQQYTVKTAKLLFHHSHLEYWNGFILAKAWEFQYIFDAVIALGAMHRAVLLLGENNTRTLGVETQIFAFEAYGKALNHVHQICTDEMDLDREMLVVTLILFTYFEVSLLHKSPRDQSILKRRRLLLAILQALSDISAQLTTI